MMNLDALSMMQIMFLFMVFAGVVVLGIKIYKFRRNCICKLLKTEYRRALNYAKGLTVKDYTSFEKYGIWRHFTHFKGNDVLGKLLNKKERVYEHHFSDTKQFIEISLSHQL